MVNDYLDHKTSYDPEKMNMESLLKMAADALSSNNEYLSRFLGELHKETHLANHDIQSKRQDDSS